MTIEDFLLEYQHEHIYYKPNPGNGGDALIAYGTFHLFKQLKIRYSIINENTSLNNKIVFYAGGGNLVKEYGSAASFIAENLARFKELVVLPHTINSHDELIKQFGKNVSILCREEFTYKYIKSLNPNCNSYLIEDVAFSLPLAHLKSMLKRNIISIFCRIYCFKMLRLQGRMLSPILSILFSKRLNVFRIDSERTNIRRPKDNLDLPLFILYDGNMADENIVKKNVVDIFSVVNKYKIVSTNRLHICITAALLGKEVNFYPNSYYKNESVYLMSLKQNFPNVRWCGDNMIGPQETGT